ncbi:uncharacterized protein LOC120848781 [Ixodes scapularis]|uniref:uncharacterized protein LOC120848781 n=1 Tax=Ixodes scapularis TaxID=6945 RepID=UPI001C394D56|nr:uncharacterized protein LOC120848781 [Ixodes scapularis]
MHRACSSQVHSVCHQATAAPPAETHRACSSQAHCACHQATAAPPAETHRLVTLVLFGYSTKPPNSLQGLQQPSALRVSPSDGGTSCGDAQGLQQPSALRVSPSDGGTSSGDAQGLQQPSALRVSPSDGGTSSGDAQGLQQPSALRVSPSDGGTSCGDAQGLQQLSALRVSPSDGGTSSGDAQGLQQPSALRVSPSDGGTSSGDAQGLQQPSALRVSPSDGGTSSGDAQGSAASQDESDDTSELAALVMSYTLRHKDGDKSTADLLRMLNIIAPGRVPQSKYLLMKALGAHTAEADKHYYCLVCKDYLGASLDISHCENCGAEIDVDSCPFFLVIPLKEQLQRILSQPNLKWVPATSVGPLLSDIAHGLEHVRLCEDFSENDLSLLWNTDGIRVFEKSTYDIWPIQCQIIQLDPSMRKANMLMPAIWFGHTKPNMSALLEPFTRELQELALGFPCIRDGKTVNTRVFAVVCSVDAVARSAVKNCKQFNGYFGCGWCYHPGGSHYPYLDPAPEQRSEEAHTLEAEEGTPGAPVNGVKGPSLIMKLPRFNPIDGFIPDYQHCVCLGVMRQLLKLWLDTENHDQPWYVGTKLGVMNGILLGILPPTEITRTPRRFEERAFWKASEFRALLLFYGYVVLKPVLPPQYFQHFALLAYGTYLLLKQQVSFTDICEARALLSKFVLQMERLYGIQHMSYNVHQLLHLSDAVIAWGPLWATSCFPFEGRNAVLLSYFAGTQCVGQQIARTFIRWQELAPWVSSMNLPQAAEFFEEMMGRKTIGRTGTQIPGDVVVYTRQSSGAQDIRFEVALERALNALPLSIVYYHRFQCNGILWHSETYPMPKRANCVAQLSDGSFGIVQALAVFKPSSTRSHVEHLVLMEKMKLTPVVGFKDGQLGVQFLSVREGMRSGALIACSSKQLAAKCVITERTENTFLVIPLPNKVERD